MTAQASPTSGSIPVLVRLKFTTVRTVLWVALRVLGLSGLYQAGRLFALAEWTVNFKRRRRFDRAMRRVMAANYHAARARRACRKYFIRARCDKLYYLIFDFIKRDTILARTRFVGLQDVDAALDRGRGVYVALCHLGAHHVVGLIMNLLGYPVAGVRDPNEGPLRTYVQKMYAKRLGDDYKLKVLYTNTLPRDIYRCLKDNYILGSALDVDRIRDARLKRVAVSFFGEEKQWIIGTLQIGMRCKSDLCQAFVVSKPNFHYEVIRQPLTQADEVLPAEEEAVAMIMQRYADNIEAFARKHPDHISRI